MQRPCRVSHAEWETRVDLAACYRLVHHYGMDDLVYNHISVRVPGTEEYLLNAMGLMYDEICASSLLKVDLKGKVPFVVVLGIVMAFVVVSVSPPQMLFILFLVYALSGPVLTIVQRQRRDAMRPPLCSSDP